MRNPSCVLLLGCSIFASVAVAQDIAPNPVLAESLRWMSSPNLSGVQASWVLGADQKPGTYVLRVKLANGAKIPPHIHPDERVSTVLAGTIYVGFSETFDEGKAVAIPTGAIYVAPANRAHQGRRRYVSRDWRWPDSHHSCEAIGDEIGSAA
jgi:quercetin dioxygenase-like cupin family protein